MKAAPKYFFVFSLLAIMALVLSACGGTAATTASDGPTAEGVATDSAVTADASESALACPYGKWQVTNFDSYMQSVMSNINNMQTEATVSNNSTTGTAYLTFNEDGTGSFEADNFINSFTMSISVGGASMDYPVVLTQNGTSTAHYTVEGDKITFLDQDLGDLVITIDVSGSTTNLDTSVLGTPGETQLYQFTCVDANTLSLKVTAVENMDLAPLTFTRVP